MNNAKKRERSENFTREETERLISLIEPYKNIVENKKSNSITWQQKEKAWRAIAAEYNSSGFGTYRFRNAKHLKIKYESLKRDARKKSLIREKRTQTGSGVNDAPSLTLMEQKVQGIISSTAEGGESITLTNIYNSEQQGAPKENRPLDKLIERKLEIALLQKKMIEEELEEKILKKQMMKNEIQHKNELYTLEREERLLKIEILKTDLENKKKLYL